MGLTLIHGNSERSTKPRVIVVAETDVHEALLSDPELDVYPECFDYDSFVKASLSKSISTNNAIVLVSDSLSQRVAPLEAVIALVRSNVVLIPWKSSEEEIGTLNVASSSPRPTANTLRRAIFQHAGMKDLPARFDGDEYIEEPPDAHVMNFSTHEMNETPQAPIPSHADYVAPVEQRIEVQQPVTEVPSMPVEEVASRTKSTQVEEPSFLPEYFSHNKDLRPENSISAWSIPAPESGTTSAPENLDEGLVPTHISDELKLDDYVSHAADMDVYEEQASTVTSAHPGIAFTPSDSDGSPQMWSMFDTNIDHSQSSSLMSDFPDGNDHRKVVSLAEPLVLCVYSPKGGVGKTSISVNLAARLAYTTRLQVCIVDLDIAFGNVGTRLGLYNPTVRELLNEAHLDSESLARNLVYDRRSGLFALLAPLRPETGTNRRKFSPITYKKILSLLKERFDVVILDCPVELRDPLVSGFALTQAGKIIMVVNNEQATLLDARRALEAMCRPKDSQRLPGLGLDPTTVGMVVNQKVENVGREVDDIKAILGGGDLEHPSRRVEILSVIQDDRQLWVGNANMARTVATSGENDVDQLLDEMWHKILPQESTAQLDSQEFAGSQSPLDEIFSSRGNGMSKKKRKFNLFKHE